MPEGRIYLGIGYLSAVLKQMGHETSLVHVVEPPEREWLVARVKAEAPYLVGFSSTTHMFRHVARWAGWLREELDVPAACGGVHPTIATAEVIETPGIDFACIGEAEDTLLELCEALEQGDDPSEIQGFWARKPDGAVAATRRARFSPTSTAFRSPTAASLTPRCSARTST